MRIGIIGGHGQIALLLGKMLADRSDEVTGFIRNPDQAAALRAVGITPVLLDLEDVDPSELTEAFSGLEAVVFAAGAGPGSSKERKDSVDRNASDLAVRAAESAGVPRFLQISSMGAGDPPDDDGIFSHYLRAKSAAEQALRDSTLSWIVLRPGGLTNDSPTHQVELGSRVPHGSIPRSDVAALLVGLLDRPNLTRSTLEATSGATDIAQALDTLAN
jgi:uncharacterized protein YbjT (DUF2867 family)